MSTTIPEFSSVTVEVSPWMFSPPPGGSPTGSLV
jgi:hypothetical protein